MKKLIIGITITIVSLAGMAQINVFPGNNVAIGAGLTSESSTLGINSIGSIYNAVTINALPSHSSALVLSSNGANSCNGILAQQLNTSSSSIIRGLWGYSYSTIPQSIGQSFGVIGTAGNSTNGYNYGVWGNLIGTNTGAGIYGSVGSNAINLSDFSSTQQYAGYFTGGDVKIATGKLWVGSVQITSSDKRLKKNIAILDSSDKIFTLQPKKYNLKTRNELIANGIITSSTNDTSKTTSTRSNNSEYNPDYYKKQHFGFLAQDIQQVYPDLVYTSGDGTLGVDYQAFIPIIVAQLQIMKKSADTMQQQIDDKEARIASLEKQVAKLKNKN